MNEAPQGPHARVPLPDPDRALLQHLLTATLALRNAGMMIVDTRSTIEIRDALALTVQVLERVQGRAAIEGLNLAEALKVTS